MAALKMLLAVPPGQDPAPKPELFHPKKRPAFILSNSPHILSRAPEVHSANSAQPLLAAASLQGLPEDDPNP